MHFFKNLSNQFLRVSTTKTMIEARSTMIFVAFKLPPFIQDTYE
jgi:hypothetical protein